MEATVFEIAGGPADPPLLIKGVGTKRLHKGRVKVTVSDFLKSQRSDLIVKLKPKVLER